MQKNTRIKRTHTDESAEEYIQFRIYKVSKAPFVSKYWKKYASLLNLKNEKNNKIKDTIEIDETITTGLRLYANDLIRIGSSGSYINNREVTARFRVDPAHYIIIPSTYDEDRSAEFMLRIFTEQTIETK